eukprot:5107064-Alexandrium_andersonii.AAC.1
MSSATTSARVAACPEGGGITRSSSRGRHTTSTLIPTMSTKSIRFASSGGRRTGLGARVAACRRDS